MDIKRKTKLIKVSAIVVAALLVLFVIAPYSISAIVLNVVFNRRFCTDDYLRFSVDDFDGLQAERHIFTSNNGQKLVGYRYYVDNANPKGVVIVAHGFGGGGQNGYMDVAYYFVRHGYQVFAYDATGNDESDGKVGGLEQGVIDLNSAIAYASKLPQLVSLPIVLWGHSWGGYSATCALAYNRNVKAVANVAGFHCASDMLKIKGTSYGGSISGVLLPYVRSVERSKFRQYSSVCGLDAVRDSVAGVLVAHGAQDSSVPMQYGYDAYYARFSGNARFKFVSYDDKGHTDILYSQEGWAYMQWLQQTIEHCSDAAERQALINNIDRQILRSRLNTDLFDQIVNFYDKYVLAI